MVAEKDKPYDDASFTRFCRIVLSWDYFALLSQATKHEEFGDGTDLDLREVKNTYKDVDDYISTFEPLIFEEIKAQIIQQKDEEDVTDWMMRLVIECSETEGFILPAVTFADDEGEKVSQNDLLLLSKERVKVNGKLPDTYAFALVEHRQRNLLRLRMFLDGEINSLAATAAPESCARLLNMRALITSPLKPQEKVLFSLKICSLSTISREYLAMRSVASFPFSDVILKAVDKVKSLEDHSWKISKPLHIYLKEILNKSQLEAIHAGLSCKAFTLIQGPPGTGKTQTILALLSAILHATPGEIISKNGSFDVKNGHKLSNDDKRIHWARASPWLAGANVRDLNMPKDGDDGFFPMFGNELKPEVVSSRRRYRVRVLVCAPSNSALDEIVQRLLKSGICDENVRKYSPKIVRIGLKAHHSIQSVCMDYLVKQKRGESASEKLKHGASGVDIDSFRNAILDEAVIVFSTLSFSGSTLFSKLNHGFDVVIIDEAAQAVEPATLVPLSTRCRQVFLVGDPVQLPATVISRVAEKFGYGTSLFERLQRAGYPVNMLTMQYRMHPEVRSFPSKEFYAEALQDAEDIMNKTVRDWHNYRCFGPFCFFDIHEGKESQPGGSGSWVNTDEIEFILQLYNKLVSTYPTLRLSSELAIISPYRHQVKVLQEQFCDLFGQDSEKYVDIQTVDGFQGREKDVVIFSCVRASKDKGIGFVSDARRMNVGITRAKSTVLVVGSASTLSQDVHWNNLLENAKKRNALFKISKPYLSFFSESNLASMAVEVKDGEGQHLGDAEFHDMENVAAYGNLVATDHGQEDENDEADMDVDDAGLED